MIETHDQALERITNMNLPKGSEVALIVFTGACSPVHKCHVANVIKAMEEVKKGNEDTALAACPVIAGILGPSNDLWIRDKSTEYDGKERVNMIPWEHRLNMAKVAVRSARKDHADQELAQALFVGDWEITQDGTKENCWTDLDYPQVIDHYKQTYEDVLKKVNGGDLNLRLRTYYVCGGDHYLEKGLDGPINDASKALKYDTFVLNRGDQDQARFNGTQGLKLWNRNRKEWYYREVNTPPPGVRLLVPPKEAENEDLSSTMIRQTIRTNDKDMETDLAKTMCPAQVEYIVKNLQAIRDPIMQEFQQ